MDRLAAMSFAEYCRACPGCGMAHAFEWSEREQAGWCIACGYFQHYYNYQHYLSSRDDEESVG
jgi:Zn ribbon nucleic-acid-binding protein